MAMAWQEVDAAAATAIARLRSAGETGREPVAPMPGQAAATLDWRKRMSDIIASALLVYTALQIFVTMNALKSEGGSLLPYLALIILVAAIIPSCRRFERRWNRLTEAQAADRGLAPWFRRDRLIVWTVAIGLPFAITAAFRLLALAFPDIAH